MSEPLEELRAQRDLIQKHLDWLDQRIVATEELLGATPEKKATAAQDATLPAKVIAQAVISTAPSTRTATVTVPVMPIEATTEETLELPELTSNTSSLRSAQIGCVAIFAAITLLFIFLLFGLPYLLD